MQRLTTRRRDTWRRTHCRRRMRSRRETIEADIVIAASGPLSRPAMPQIAGLERFEGKLFHSARWDHDYPLEGKRVAVIGTGASAIQFVPQIQPRVAQLELFQRTAPWIMPKPDKPISERAQWWFRHLPFTQRFVRNAIYWQLESRAIAFVVNPKLMKFPMKFGLSYLERRVKDPALRAKLTPNYRLGCKRVLMSSDYYPALSQPNVDVVTTARSARSSPTASSPKMACITPPTRSSAAPGFRSTTSARRSTSPASAAPISAPCGCATGPRRISAPASPTSRISS